MYIFDLDGVITRRDTFALLVAQVLRSRLTRLPRILPLVLYSLTLSPTDARRPVIHRKVVARALAGMTVAQYRVLAQKFGRKLAANKNLICQEALSEIRRYDPAEVVIATGSEKLLVQSLLKGLGLGEITLLASDLELRDHHIQFKIHNIGKQKVSSLVTAGIPLSQAHLYTDSATDLPLARACAHTTVVNPSKRSARLYGALNPPVTFVHW